MERKEMGEENEREGEKEKRKGGGKLVMEGIVVDESWFRLR